MNRKHPRGIVYVAEYAPDREKMIRALVKILEMPDRNTGEKPIHDPLSDDQEARSRAFAHQDRDA